MVNCIRCNEPIVYFSPTACVCSTCYAVDDLPRHEELPRIKLSARTSRPQEYKGGEWVDMQLGGYYTD
jgi:hypothetical protein